MHAHSRLAALARGEKAEILIGIQFLGHPTSNDDAKKGTLPAFASLSVLAPGGGSRGARTDQKKIEDKNLNRIGWLRARSDEIQNG